MLAHSRQSRPKTEVTFEDLVKEINRHGTGQAPLLDSLSDLLARSLNRVPRIENAKELDNRRVIALESPTTRDRDDGTLSLATIDSLWVNCLISFSGTWRTQFMSSRELGRG